MFRGTCEVDNSLWPLIYRWRHQSRELEWAPSVSDLISRGCSKHLHVANEASHFTQDLQWAAADATPAQREHAPHRCSLPVAARITHLHAWCLCASPLEAWSLFSRPSWSVTADHFLSCEPNVWFPVCGHTSALWSGPLCWPCPSTDRTWSAHFPALTVTNFPVLQITLAQSSTVQRTNSNSPH